SLIADGPPSSSGRRRGDRRKSGAAGEGFKICSDPVPSPGAPFIEASPCRARASRARPLPEATNLRACCASQRTGYVIRQAGDSKKRSKTHFWFASSQIGRASCRERV